MSLKVMAQLYGEEDSTEWSELKRTNILYNSAFSVAGTHTGYV